MRNERVWPQQCWKSGANDPTLLRYASAIKEQKKCWELLAKKFDRFQTLHNNMQQGVQTEATSNIQQRYVRLHGALNNFQWAFGSIRSESLEKIPSPRW